MNAIDILTTAAAKIAVEQGVTFARRGLEAKFNEKVKREQIKQSGHYFELYCKKFNKVRTLLTPTEALEKVTDIFVSTELSSNRNKVNFSELKDSLVPGKHFLVTGGAGSGKSMLLKYLFLNSDMKRVHVFINARDITDYPNMPDSEDFEAKLLTQFELIYGIMDHSLLYRLLKSGSVVIYLDGLDEVAPDHKQSVFGQIENLCYRFPRSTLIASSRPESIWQNLSSMQSFRMEPLTNDQKIEIVNKINCKQERKDIFLENLDQINRAAVDLTTRPLLLIAAFIAYEYDTHIPLAEYDLIHNAVEALVRRHDSLKDGWSRVFKSSLAKGQIILLIDRIGFKMYYSERHELSKSDFLALLEDQVDIVIKPSDPKPNIEHVYHDVVIAAGIIVEDDGVVQFIHRAFLQYAFTTYLPRLNNEQWADLYHVKFRVHADWLVMKMLQYSNEELFLRHIMTRFREEWKLSFGSRLGINIKNHAAFYVRNFSCIESVPEPGKYFFDIEYVDGRIVLRHFVLGYANIDSDEFDLVRGMSLFEMSEMEQKFVNALYEKEDSEDIDLSELESYVSDSQGDGILIKCLLSVLMEREVERGFDEIGNRLKALEKFV